MSASKNKQLRFWLDTGLTRCAAVARYMGSSRQYIDERANHNRGISENQWTHLKYAMAIVEDDERGSQHHIEQNILRSAKLCSSKDYWISLEARRNLNKWVMILGKLKDI